MKLSDYARRLGVSYKTAWRWRRAGKLDAYQVTTGTIIVRAPTATLVRELLTGQETLGAEERETEVAEDATR